MTIFPLERDEKTGVYFNELLLELVPELYKVYEKYGYEVVKYFIAVYDFRSPYRHLELGKRMDECAARFLKDKRVLSDDICIDAANEYESLASEDPVIAAFISTENNIHYLSTGINQDVGNAELILKIAKELPKLVKDYEDARDKFIHRIKEVKTKGGAVDNWLTRKRKKHTRVNDEDSAA